jgi:eukaryotic-like serine/threonine-protein kinase
VPLNPGSRLGTYEIIGLLGVGGMGEVYRARDARLGRDVAVKVLPSDLAARPDALTRFEREARAVAALSHPGILAIHDFGTANGVTYAVMELLDGESLRDALGDGPLPVRKAIDLAMQIARALAAAHDKGIIHRDIKPDNVFVTAGGQVKVLDFGLAHYHPAAMDISQAATLQSPSAPGIVMGTVGYMAPEQVRGGTVDSRADIFAFGALLYEMLTGRRPFARDTAAETMTAILREDVAEMGAGILPALERIVRRCLEKRPGARFQSADDLAFALDAISSMSTATTGSAAITTRKVPRAPIVAALSALIAVAFAAGGGV